MVEARSTAFTAAERQTTVEEERAPTPPTHSPLRARTPTPSETSTGAQDKPTDEGAEPEQIDIYSPEVEALVAQAESLHIPTDEPMTTQTQMQMCIREEPPYLCINPVTGHVLDVDLQDAPAIYRALGSDHADPPDMPQPPQIPRWQFNIPGRGDPGGPPPGGGRGGGQLPCAPRPPPGNPLGGRGGGGGGGGRGGCYARAERDPTWAILGDALALVEASP